jgi:hypothetical protein
MRRRLPRPALSAAIGVVVTTAGCAPPIPDGGFAGPDPASRIYAAARVAAEFDRTGVLPDRATLEQLVIMLGSADPANRFVASETLKAMAETDFGYHPSAPLPERAAAQDRWRLWVATIGEAAS